MLIAKGVGLALADSVVVLKREEGKGVEGGDDDAVGTVLAGEGVDEGGAVGEEVAVPS